MATKMKTEEQWERELASPSGHRLMSEEEFIARKTAKKVIGSLTSAAKKYGPKVYKFGKKYGPKIAKRAYENSWGGMFSRD